MRLDAVLAEDRIGPWLETVEANVGRRDAATSFFGAWLVAPVVMASVAAVLLESCSPDLAPDTVYLHHNEGGWFDGVAFAGRMTTTGQASSLGPEAVVVPDADALRRHWAENISTSLAPLLDEVSRLGRFNRRGLWGVGVVDRTMSVATTLAREDAPRGEHHLGTADRLLASLSGTAPLTLPKPRLYPVAWRDETVQMEVKSCCCLFYKTVEAIARTTDNYCTGCPLLRDEVRQPRWARWLDEVHAPAAALASSS